jgi:hypothetical protein
VNYLVAWGADVNALDINLLTPLHLAVKAADQLNSTRTVRHLLIKGARRDVKDTFGRTPLDIVNQENYKNLSIQNDLRTFLVCHRNFEKVIGRTEMVLLNAQDPIEANTKKQRQRDCLLCTRYT